MSIARGLGLLLVPLLIAGALPAGGSAQQPLLAFSHGPDPLPTVDLVDGASLVDPGVACVGPDEPHLRVLFAQPRDASVLEVTTAPTRVAVAEKSLLHANAILFANAQEHGVSIRLKALCDEDGSPSIELVKLDLRRSEVDFWALAWELQARGYGGADEKILVYYDGGWTECGCGGWASGAISDQPGPDNPINLGYNSYAAIFLGNYGATMAWALDEVVLHEITHTMGGVQKSAPHASGAGHCNDGWDIMCYDDGGPTSNYATTCFPVGHSYVAIAQPYDCGNDDYFHPSPPPGSYLATHWNVGAAYNRFLLRG